MKLVITKLYFCLDFLEASERLYKKLGKSFCEENNLRTAEDLIEFKNIVGEWMNPQYAIIFINDVPWIISFSELRHIPNDDSILRDANLSDGGLVVFRYIGKDNELLKAIMKEPSKITATN